MAKPLVIVESPAKAKTLGRFLGTKYRVEASYGHIRDLPESAAEVPKEIKPKEWGRMGVDVDQDFTPYYVVPDDKKKQVALLKLAVKEASELLLATDPDREGESISWHLREVLKPKVPVRRIVFHEITEEAVNEALKHPGQVDENLVRAQESRRILDRLYGYTLSPLLWKKVQTGLSAGRVQSVAVRLIVEREEERRAFHTGVYWDIEATLAGEGRPFTATLVRVGDVVKQGDTLARLATTDVEIQLRQAIVGQVESAVGQDVALDAGQHAHAVLTVEGTNARGVSERPALVESVRHRERLAVIGDGDVVVTQRDRAPDHGLDRVASVAPRAMDVKIAQEKRLVTGHLRSSRPDESRREGDGGAARR